MCVCKQVVMFCFGVTHLTPICSAGFNINTIEIQEYMACERQRRNPPHSYLLCGVYWIGTSIRSIYKNTSIRDKWLCFRFQQNPTRKGRENICPDDCSRAAHRLSDVCCPSGLRCLLPSLTPRSPARRWSARACISRLHAVPGWRVSAV